MTLSADAAGALLQLLGIIHDNGVSVDVARTATIETMIHSTWPLDELGRPVGPDRELELEIEDVAALFDGLAYTEMMSVDLPWFEMVRWSVDFMTAELRPLWTDDEWARLGAG
ncbi:MAG: hypothetical protein AAF467_26395 [Actinomycetota bacterium]